MMSCMVDALGSYPQTGAESNYISEINGLSSQGGAMSGWMGTLNDWFTNEGFGAFTAAKGTLKAGDEIRIMYTCNYGEDLGGSWSNTDKTVKNVAFSAGTLDKAFDKNAHEYTLTIPADVNTSLSRPPRPTRTIRFARASAARSMPARRRFPSRTARSSPSSAATPPGPA